MFLTVSHRELAQARWQSRNIMSYLQIKILASQKVHVYSNVGFCGNLCYNTMFWSGRLVPAFLQNRLLPSSGLNIQDIFQNTGSNQPYETTQYHNIDMIIMWANALDNWWNIAESLGHGIWTAFKINMASYGWFTVPSTQLICVYLLLHVFIMFHYMFRLSVKKNVK
jgi:hypothetical protein